MIVSCAAPSYQSLHSHKPFILLSIIQSILESLPTMCLPAISNKDGWFDCGDRRMRNPASCSSMTATITTAPASLLILCGNHELCPSASLNGYPTETDASNTLTSDQWRTTNRIATPYQQSFAIASSSSWSTFAFITRSSHAEMSSSLSRSTTSSPAPSSMPTIEINQAHQANTGSSNVGTSSTGTSITVTSNVGISSTGTSSTGISSTSSTAIASGVDSKPSAIWIGSVTASVCAFLILIGLILCTPNSQFPFHASRGMPFTPHYPLVTLPSVPFFLISFRSYQCTDVPFAVTWFRTPNNPAPNLLPPTIY